MRVFRQRADGVFVPETVYLTKEECQDHIAFEAKRGDTTKYVIVDA